MSLLGKLFGLGASQSDAINVLSNQEFKEGMKKKNAQLVDVRTPGEFRQGHYKNAKNIDFFDSANFMKHFEKFDKEKPLYLYCRSGMRSHKAAVKLAQVGFQEIYDLRGGYR